MRFHTRAALAGLLFLPLIGSAATAAALAPAQMRVAAPAAAVEKVQFRPRVHISPRVVPRAVIVPRAALAPRWIAPRAYVGRPYWFARPWAARPHYGTIIAGVALGTLITVAAVGAIPRRPAPDLCWYWADPDATQGYWDYCG